MKVKLNERLLGVASYVEENDSIIDVGCDHAFLPIYLVQDKNMKKVIASDIKEGPIKAALENIKKYQLEDQIIVKLGSGIEPIENDIHTIIISGMGGLNMVGILKYKPNLYQQVDTLILSPNSDISFVRYEICKLGFWIADEKLVKDKNIIYPIIKFKRGKRRYHKIDYVYGPILRKEKSHLFLEYIQREIKNKEKLVDGLPKKYYLKKKKLKKELKILKKIYK